MKKRMLIFGFLVMGLAMPVLAGSSRSDDVSRIQAATDVFKEIRDPIAFLIILVALVIRPSGLLGTALAKKA